MKKLILTSQSYYESGLQKFNLGVPLGARDRVHKFILFIAHNLLFTIHNKINKWVV